MFFILCFGKLSTEFLNGDDRGESQEQFDIRVLTLEKLKRCGCIQSLSLTTILISLSHSYHDPHSMHLSSLQSVSVDHRRSLFPQFWESKNVRRGGEPIYVNMIPLDSKVSLANLKTNIFLFDL
ncbi:LOW QUALITY PROTEIN: hypothetical protein YC2023_050322 [Brassica napus]